jgi:multisubunit Na+/H+ antiporter MnhC subunit
MFRMLPSSVIRNILKTVITSSGTGRIVFAGGRGGVVPTPPRQRSVAKTVRPVPDAVITVLSVLLMVDEGIIRNM